MSNENQAAETAAAEFDWYQIVYRPVGTGGEGAAQFPVPAGTPIEDVRQVAADVIEELKSPAPGVDAPSIAGEVEQVRIVRQADGATVWPTEGN